MKYRTAISVVAASILALTSFSSFAGPGQRGGASSDRAQQVDRGRTYDRDRIEDRARSEVPDRDRDRIEDRARTEVPDQDRDRDRLNIQDPSQMRDQDIYGHEFMTAQERDQYREQLGNADTSGTRNEFQTQHEEKMQKRALAQGQDLVPPGQGPVYGGEFMTVQERNEYREQLRLLDSDKERQQYMAKHQEKMDERARALGYEIEEAE